jgi:acetylornithine deacetylase
MSVSNINGGIQHNIVPDTCNFTVDIRTTNEYSHTEILETIKTHTSCSISPRSKHLQPSFISHDHPIVKAGLSLGKKAFGSATLSDQALMNFPTLKMGPGDTKRSHSRDEFIYLHEIEEGVYTYINLLKIIL